jgi:hypothetical protein
VSLRDELSQYRYGPSRVCTVQVVLEDAGEDRNEIAELLNDQRVTAASLGRLLRNHGYEIRDGSITRHRRKECVCDNA